MGEDKNVINESGPVAGFHSSSHELACGIEIQSLHFVPDEWIDGPRQTGVVGSNIVATNRSPQADSCALIDGPVEWNGTAVAVSEIDFEGSKLVELKAKNKKNTTRAKGKEKATEYGCN